MDNLISNNIKDLVIPETVNFTELVRTSNTILSLNSESKMIDILNNEFTQQESQWYITNLYIYLNYHPTNDYPINLENVYKMLGFANKGNAMKTIKSNFIKDEDYKVTLLHTEKRKNEGGFNKEDVMLNVDTFKNLCMIAKTEKGKEIRRYYVKLENIHNKIIKEEIEQQKILLNEKDTQLLEKEEQLLKIQKFQTKKWFNQEPSDMVYAVKTKTGLIKIGKSKDIKIRESHYISNKIGEMFYIKKCFNCDLTERVLHHMLDKHRIENNKEWFEISESIATYTIDIVCDFLDKFVDISEKLQEFKIKEFLEEASIKINNNVKIIKPIINKIVNIETYEDKMKKFINEYCELDDSYHTIKLDLYGAYRIWSRGLNLTDNNNFTKYMNKHFKSTRKLYKEYNNTTFLMYLGIKPKEFVINRENKIILPKYEEFILNECKYSYTYRIRYTDLISEYTKWHINKYPEYVFSKEERINLEAYLNRHFFKHRINMPGHRNVPGVWGLQLKSDNFQVGTNSQCRKTIVKIDSDTKEIIEEYQNVLIASEKLNLDKQTIQRLIKNEKVRDDFILEYKSNIDLFE